MKLSRRASWFLAAFGVWSAMIWSTFVKNLWQDSAHQAFTGGGHAHPTPFFWIHLLLALTSLALGLAIGALGLRGTRALRRD